MNKMNILKKSRIYYLKNKKIWTDKFSIYKLKLLRQTFKFKRRKKSIDEIYMKQSSSSFIVMSSSDILFEVL